MKSKPKKSKKGKTEQRPVVSSSRLVRPLSQDIRSPLAKARDNWLDSAEGQTCRSGNILRDYSQRRYLENRLESAFIAGANWSALHLAKRKRPNQQIY